MKLGTKQFYKGEPVLYFDTLKTSSLEGSATTVYAQGGRGNARLLAWDGEKTTTFTMEDALISPEGLMILAGAKLLDSTNMSKGIIQHMNITVNKSDVAEDGSISLVASDGTKYDAYKSDEKEDTAYAMLVKDGEIISEPYICTITAATRDSNGKIDSAAKVKIANITAENRKDGAYTVASALANEDYDSIMIDFYTQVKKEGAVQIEITADSFGSNFYLEASTLFRNELGQDIPAEFVIPNCKIQSNFNFSMASSGDPSTFTFTIDCFPDYTRWDKTHKVLAAIQLIPDVADDEDYRKQTDADAVINADAEG